MNRWVARLLALVLAAAAVYLVYANVHSGSLFLECTLAAAVIAIATVLLVWKRPAAALILNVVWLVGAFGVAAWLSPGHQLPNLRPQSGEVAQNGTAVASKSNGQPDRAIDAVAKQLGNQPEAILARVARVRYEIYPGVFRGATVTFLDGAGNDYDRALLLHDVLIAANAGSVRYAFCTLNAQQVDAAIAAAQKAYVAPNVAANADAAAAKASTPQRRDAATKMATFWRAASAQQRQQATELAADFQKAGAQLAPPNPAAVRTIAADHVWVQLQSQGSWTDLDPSEPRAKPGAAVCSAAKTSDALPDAAYDTETVTLQLESRDGGKDSDATVATGSWRTADLGDTPLTFAFAEPSGLASPAPQPTGMRAYTPLIVAGTQTTAASPIVLPAPTPGTSVVKAGSKGAVSGGSQALQAFGSAPPIAATSAPSPSGPIPVALRLVVAVTAPNGTVTVERPIFDRVSASDRAAGRAATADLAPLSHTPFGTVWNVAASLGTGVVGVGNLTAPSTATDDPAALNNMMGLAHRSYYTLRRALFGDGAQAATAIVSVGPGISFLGLAPQAAGPAPFGLAMDRGTDASVPLGGDASSGLRWAVASVYAERLAIASPKMMATQNLDTLPFDDAIEMFYIARHTNVAPALVRSSSDVASLSASGDAKTRLVASLSSGSAVIPSAPVGYGGDKDFGWWLVRTDGSVSDEMQSGMHQEMEEEGVETKEAAEEEAPVYRKTGFIVRCIGLAAGAMMAVAAAGGGEGASEIAEQVPELVHAIYESNEKEEMMEESTKCAGG
jgi:hypothetical protein